MKYYIILLSALFFTTGSLKAQENVSIGPMVGVNISNFRGNTSAIGNNPDWKPGLTIGGFYNYSSQSGFGFSGQLLFTQMGAKMFDNNKIRLNYIQVPILATYFFGRRGSAVRPKIFAGPTFNFLLTAKDKYGNNFNPSVGNKNYEPFDLGLTFGGGLNYRLKNKMWLNLDVRYGLGLLDVSTDANKMMNSSWGLNAGVSFPLGTFNKKTGRLKTR